MPTRVRSHAKINLGLAIGAPRPDGFHGLSTVYQTLEAHDIVTVSARPAAQTALRLTSNDERVPADSRNTAWKMVALALDALQIAAEVEIHIEKRLPVQGGLGAGSANAVAALMGLEAELRAGGDCSLPPIEQKAPDGWGTAANRAQNLGAPSFPRSLRKGWESTNPNQPGAPDPSLLGTWETASSDWLTRRLQLAAQVGSDVPLFLVGGTILGLDRGQHVYPLPDLEPLWCVLAIPETGVSTAQAFRDWDALCAAQGLTPEASTGKLNRLSRAYLSAFGVQTPEDRPGSSGVFSIGEDLAGPATSALVRTGITSWIENDFERVVFPQHPSLAEIKRTLAADGQPEAALYAALSGSGSALFGLYKARGDAEAAVNRLTGLQGLETRMTQTLPRTDYWRQMILQ